MTDDNVAKLIEAFVARWLIETDLGQSAVEKFGFEEAMDSIFEALNLGVLKITGSPHALTGIRICKRPVPPSRTIHRPGRPFQ
jgi:hypothetical protein